MTRISVTSSSLQSVGYDSNEHLLEIQFQGGAVYKYFEVTADAHAALLAAESLGAHFNRNIRDKYRCHRSE